MPMGPEAENVEDQKPLLRRYLTVSVVIGLLFLIWMAGLAFYTGSVTAIRLTLLAILFNLFVVIVPIWFYRAGRVETAIAGAAGVQALMSPLFAVFAPGFRAPAVILPIVGILIAFSLGNDLTRRRILWFGAACFMGSMLYSILFKQLPDLPKETVMVVNTAVWCGGFALIAILLNSFTTRLTGALQLAQTSNRSLRQAQQELEAINQKLEDRVQERAATLNALMECMPSGVLAVDMQGKLLVNNSAAQAITGIKPENLPVRSDEWLSAYGLRTTDGRLLDLPEMPLRRALDGNPVTDEEYLVENEQKTVAVHVFLSSRAILDSDGRRLGAMAVFTDISSRVRTEQALAQTEQSLRSLIGNLSGMVFRARRQPPLNLLYASAGVEVLTGWPPPYFVNGGVPWEALLPPEDIERVWVELRAQFAAGIPMHVEYRIRHRDGSLRWVESRMTVLPDEPEVVEGIVTNIDARKQAEAALIENERRYRSLVSNTPGMVFRSRILAGWPMLYISDRVQSITGRPAEEFIEGGYLFGNLIVPEDLPRIEDTVSTQLEEGQDICVEFRIRRDDGALRWIESNSHLIQLEDGSEGYEGAMFDITSRKLAEQALTASEARFRLMTDAAPQIVWSSGPDGGIEFVNRGGLEYFGCSLVELSGDGWLNFMHPDDVQRRAEHRSATLASGKSIEIEYRIRRHDGQYRWHLSRGVVELDEQGRPQHWFGVITDIEDMKRSRDAAEEATRLKSAFLSSMSHEIRTPMNAILGMTSILLDTQLTPEQRDGADIIRSSSEHLLTLIDDILDYSKIEAGQMRLEREPFSLRDCIEGALDLIAGDARRKSVELCYFAAAGLPDTVLGDSGRLRQVLVNLLSNAVKFTPAHGQVSIEARSKAVDDDEYLIEFEVLDTGIGIDPEVLPQLFQAFVQADPSTTRKYGGTGLGLSISKRLVELMGGGIDARSEPGKGSTFRFCIRTALAATQQRINSQPSPQLTGMRVLVVDDLEINRRVLQHYTALWGMVAHLTDSASEALEWVRRGDVFDLALLDFHMPVMNGLQLARELRSLKPEQELPIIMLSSAIDVAHEPGVISGSVSKPIKPSRLLDELQNLFSRRARPTQAPSTGFTLQRELGREHPLRILVAEDNAVNQKVAKLMFERLGYQPDFAGNGIEVLEAVEHRIYDVVFMDIQMPLMDGLNASREICRRWAPDRRPRIIAMTANATTEDRKACELAGMDDYLFKPVAVERIVEAIKACRCRDSEDIAEDFNDMGMLNMCRLLGREGALEVVVAMMEEIPNQERTIARSLHQADAKTLQRMAHTLKGNCKMLEATALALSWEGCEKRASSGMIDPDDRYTSEMIGRYNLLMDKALEYLKRPE